MIYPKGNNMAEDRYVSQFLENFLASDLRRPVESLGKHTVHNNKYDRADYDRILKEMKELSVSEDRLASVAETGSHMMTDAFLALFKANPDLIDDQDIRPSYLINKAVMGKAMDLTEYDELRDYSVSDAIATGLSCIAIEPELESIYDKLKTEAERLKDLEKQMQQMQQWGAEAADIEQMIENLMNEDPDSEEAQNYQENQAAIQENMEKLAQAMRENAQEIDEGLDASAIGDAIGNMMDKAVSDAEGMETASKMWGLEPGALQRLPAEERIKLAKRFDNPKFRKIAELFGPMQRLAFAEQRRKTLFAREEIYDVELGDNLSVVLPTELLLLEDDILELDFYRKLIEHGLLQYKLNGTESVAKGGIIFCEDGSGSMSGDREMWAKAVGLTLLNIAKAQNRPFTGIHFGSPGQIKEFDFPDVKSIDLDTIIDFAEIFFCGGTDFVTPLSRSLDILKKQHKDFGAVKADIVFVTDGQCGVPDEWLKSFKAEQANLGFKVWGVVIGGSSGSEPLNTICDGRVFTIKNLLSGENIADIFRSL